MYANLIYGNAQRRVSDAAHTITSHTKVKKGRRSRAFSGRAARLLVVHGGV